MQLFNFIEDELVVVADNSYCSILDVRNQIGANNLVILALIHYVNSHVTLPAHIVGLFLFNEITKIFEPIKSGVSKEHDRVFS